MGAPKAAKGVWGLGLGRVLGSRYGLSQGFGVKGRAQIFFFLGGGLFQGLGLELERFVGWVRDVLFDFRAWDSRRLRAGFWGLYILYVKGVVPDDLHCRARAQKSRIQSSETALLTIVRFIIA